MMQRFENKYDLLDAIYRDTNLKKGAITLFQYLVHKSNKEQCFPSVETIAKALNVCKRTVQYNMRKLEAAGYIIRKDRYYNHQQLSNQYVFNLGIVDNVSSQERYPETVKEYISDVMEVSESAVDINKAKALMKIYEMPYSSREKLLLIYFYHKANSKGVLYARVQEVMDAIGVGSQTYYKLLSSLRRRGLVKVKHITFFGKRLLLVKLTNCFMQHVEKEVSDRGEKNQKVVHDIRKRNDCIVDSKRMQNKSEIYKWVGKLMMKCCDTIHFIKDKVCRILRI